jgi:hypothetical protein
LILAVSPAIKSQVLLGSGTYEPNYTKPETYVIGGITVSGIEHLDHGVIIVLSGLNVGDRIEYPATKSAKPLKNSGSRVF